MKLAEQFHISLRAHTLPLLLLLFHFWEKTNELTGLKIRSTHTIITICSLTFYIEIYDIFNIDDDEASVRKLGCI